SFGCSASLADGEVLAGCLVEAGFEVVSSLAAAEVVVVNTCAVKGPTEDRVLSFLRGIPSGKKVVVAGCLPLINYERVQSEVRFDAVVGPAYGQGIVGVVRRVLRGERVVDLAGASGSLPALTLPRLRLNPAVSIVPVSYGCLGSCSYCCVVFARGRLRSYSVEEVLQRVREDLACGVREFWLTSQDTACYGRDRGTNLAELLHALCSVKGDFRVRVGMMTPSLVLDMLPDMVRAFQDPKIFKFVHLPVQSGDDRVLKSMRRAYSVTDFKRIVAAFRESLPEISLSTDVICGFPGEDEEAFERTLRLIEEVQPDVVNVSRFFARPKTDAAKIAEGGVSRQEVGRRSGLVAKLAGRIGLERNMQWIGRECDVFVDEKGKISGSWVGRNFAYKPIVVKSSGSLFCKTVKVRVIKAYPTYLEGVVVE
ncbi:MAG: tRNA (N(6)-L-threonylcarbamoyladenosine(37)-C(2))-methylthiotransferase, partial [Candidatus Bathyarchaeota archaeon]|nr:tRNA (N(6)-L-threonylcarbamoyladenosine(37)-C(2))-methylthiotransferase [Candidatus Bathyarchaeota archaeon]